MASKKISRKTSTIIVVGLLAATGILAVTAAATSAETFVPLLKGADWASERSLSQRTVALAVHVTYADGDESAPAEGATVGVYEHPDAKKIRGHRAFAHAMYIIPEPIPDRSELEQVAEGTADAQGRVIFDLPRGAYVITVDLGDLTGQAMVPVPKDTRLGVAFDEAGQAHFSPFVRLWLRTHGEIAPLHLRVGENADGNLTPIENATITLTRANGTSDRNISDSTNPRGHAIVHLHKGAYVATIETPDGRTAEVEFAFRGPTLVKVVFTKDGEARVSVEPMRPAHGGPGGPHAGPPGGPA